MVEVSLGRISKDKSRDTGLALTLLLLLVSIRVKSEWIVLAAVASQVLSMTVPQIYKPLAVLWFGFSELLGAVTSKILLAVLFFVVVTPIALLRRLYGKDSLKLRNFHAGSESVMTVRNHLFTGQDIEKPY